MSAILQANHAAAGAGCSESRRRGSPGSKGSQLQAAAKCACHSEQPTVRTTASNQLVRTTASSQPCEPQRATTRACYRERLRATASSHACVLPGAPACQGENTA